MGASAAESVELAGLSSDLVRLEAELWERVDRRLRSDHDLPLSWIEPMQVMDRVADCRVADIAEELSTTVGGVSKLVDRVERTGWCVRSPNPSDARSSVLSLSSAGRRVVDAAERSFDHELATLLGAAVSAKRLASFATTVRDVRRYVADQEGSAR